MASGLSNMATEDQVAAIERIPGEGWLYIPKTSAIILGAELAARFGLPGGSVVSALGVLRRLDSGHRSKFLREWKACLELSHPFDSTYFLIGSDEVWCQLRFRAKIAPAPEKRESWWYGTCIEVDRGSGQDSRPTASGPAFSTIIRNLPSSVWAADAHGRMLYVDPTLSKLSRDTNAFDELGSLKLTDLLTAVAHQDDHLQIREAIARGLSSRQDFRLLYRQKRQDGSFGWVSGQARPLKTDYGEVSEWYGVLNDADEETLSRQVLQNREHQLLLVLQTLPAVVWEMEPDGRTTFFNRRPDEFPHYDLPEGGDGKEALFKATESTIHPDDQAQNKAGIERSMQTNVGWHMRYRRRTVDGWRWLEGRTKALLDGNGELIRWYGMAIDIEDEVRASEALRLAREDLSRLARVASLSELSASIAHELSQPLAAVAASAGACHRWLSSDRPNIARAMQSAENAYRDAKISTEIVQRVRAMFQLKQGQMSVLPANLIIEDVCRIFTQDVSTHRTGLSISLDQTEAEVMVDPLQIRQVLLNLLRNASEAMTSHSPSARTITVRSTCGAEEITVFIEDQGPGIAEPEKIFETFYTTKQDGTGLGLSICRTVITLHGGRIWAENTENGAMVAFTLKRYMSGIQND